MKLDIDKIKSKASVIGRYVLAVIMLSTLTVLKDFSALFMLLFVVFVCPFTADFIYSKIKVPKELKIIIPIVFIFLSFGFDQTTDEYKEFKKHQEEQRIQEQENKKNEQTKEEVNENNNNNTKETNNNEEVKEPVDEKKEKMYNIAKEFYDKKEYGYAFEEFDFIRGYKDVDDILKNDQYASLFGNVYKNTTTSYSMTFDFSRTSSLQITFATHKGSGGIYGAWKIVDTRIYLEKSYHTYQYDETDWYITKISDNQITVKLKNETYKLNKTNN